MAKHFYYKTPGYNYPRGPLDFIRLIKRGSYFCSGCNRGWESRRAWFWHWLQGH